MKRTMLRGFALCAAVCVPAGARAGAADVRSEEGTAPLSIRSDPGAALPAAHSEAGGKRSHRLPPIGLNVSVFLPSSPKARDDFGGAWISISPGFGRGAPRKRDVLSPSIDVLGRKHAGNSVLILQAGAKYLHVLSGALELDEDRSRSGFHLVPYVGAKAYLTWARLDTARTDRSTHWVPAGTVLAGAGLGKGFFVEARYRHFPRLEGYRFSGTELELGYRFQPRR